jgi:hypothetical protein
MEIQFTQTIEDHVEMNYLIFKRTSNYKRQRTTRLLLVVIFPLLLSIEMILKTRHNLGDIVFLGIMSSFSIYTFVTYRKKLKNIFRNNLKTIHNLKEELAFKYFLNDDHLISINEFTESKIYYRAIDKVVIDTLSVYFFVPDGNILIFPIYKITEKDTFIDYVERMTVRFQIIVERFD